MSPGRPDDPGGPAEQRRSERSAHRAEQRASRRALIDAEDFARSRAVAAMQRGDSLALEDVARRPNTALVAGVVVALLIAAGAAGSAYVTGRAPEGWQSPGTLVVDKASGARYVIMIDGLLHPAPTLTAAVLAGARPTPLLVPHAAVGTVGVGIPLPGADLPESPPVVPDRPAPLTVCVAAAPTGGPGPSNGAVDVWSGGVSTATATAQGLLVSPVGSSDLLLVAGGTAHPITLVAAEALGYSPAAVRTVPRLWLDLLPRGVVLAPLTTPAPGGDGAVAGVGAAGEVVTVAGSDQRLLVAGGQLHPFLNRTSELLGPPPVREVSGAALAAAPRGGPVGLLDAPTTPPPLPAREEEVSSCVSSSGSVTVVSDVRAQDLAASPVRVVDDAEGTSTAVVWHQRTGSGALVGPVGVDVKDEAEDGVDPSSTRGARVVSGGVAYPVVDSRTMSLLGWERGQALPLPDTWLSLAASGPSLRAAE